MQTRSWNKRRWGFLAPWCAVLKPLIRYSDVHGMTDVWDACEYLEVALPRRELKARRSHLDNSSGSDEGKASDSEEKEFLIAFQKVREALALLAAVEHVDEDAWKHLLTTYCKVDMGREGEEKYEKVPVRFLLTMDLEGITNQKDQKKVHFDLVHFCGVHQREHPSPEYAKALRQIATLDNSLTKNEPGVDIEIPVKVHFPGPLANIARPLKNLLDVGKAERVIKNQWEKYACKKQDVEPGSLRCTFVLEPMDISFLEHDNWCSSVEEMADTMERLVLDNVRFSQISSLAITRDDELEEDEECRWKKAIGLLLMRIFDSTCRPAGFANTTYRFENTGQDPDPLQVGMLEVYCADNLTLQGEFAAMCSALVVNQMTRQLLLSFDESPEDPVESAFWWKWMAYALFSKRAHACSALTSLRLLIGRMTSADIEALSAVLASSHPEEELCNRPRGKVEEKSAILRAGAPIRSEIDDSRQTAIASGVITLPSPISTVRTFSDDGKSEWVDAIISGYGRCQVRRIDLTFYEGGDVKQHSGGLTSLMVAFPGWTRPHTDGLPQFLETVGSSLKSLTLLGPRMDMDENDIFLSCPDLEELSLCGGLSTVQFNFKELRTPGQPLPAVSPINWHDLESVSAGLSDTTTTFAKAVRRLRIQLTERWDGWARFPGGYIPRGFEADLEPLLTILETNQSLEYFEVVVPQRSEYVKYISDFRKYHLKPIPRALEPLSSARKIAFLSVFSSRRNLVEPSKKKAHLTSRPQGPLCALNQEAIRTIFAFAAIPVLRQVYFRVDNNGIDWSSELGQLLA